MTQTIEAVEVRLRDEARKTLDDLVCRRSQLEAELVSLVSEREDVHFEALIGHDFETLRRLTALNDKISDLRAEHAAFRAGITAAMADLEG